MNGEFEETEAGQLLQATQRLRVQWTSVNSSLIGYTGALFIGIWTFALKASLDAKAEKAAVDDAAVYLLWAAASASIMLGLWRIFARYLDKAIVQLYPTLIYCEQTMCVPMEYGTCAYLRDHVSVANSSEAEWTCPHF